MMKKEQQKHIHPTPPNTRITQRVPIGKRVAFCYTRHD